MRRAPAVLAGATLVLALALPAMADETVTGTKWCSGSDYAGTTANGSGEVWIKPPGASRYYSMGYEPSFRSESLTVFSEGAWGASAPLLLESVTYAWCS